ncbi:MAG: hypothetical protein M0017_10175 [Desulfobacteraceae bacterium]|nr:hypothetical protein [Desulfobacteraceae bacterium]
MVPSDPLRIAFGDGVNILSFKVLRQTKEANNFRFVKEEALPHKLMMGFSFLDPDDGIALEILHDGKERYPRIAGTMKGFPRGFEDLGRVETNRPGKARGPFNPFLRPPKLLFWAAICAGLGMVVFGLLPREIRAMLITESHRPKSNTSMTFIIMGIIYAAIPAAFLWLRRKKYPKQLEIEEVEP